jgi:ankyrin repeat protein
MKHLIAFTLLGAFALTTYPQAEAAPQRKPVAVKKAPPKPAVKPPAVVKPAPSPTPTPIDYTAQLIRGLQQGDPKLVSEAANKGAQLNVRSDQNGYTPLMTAIYRDQTAIVDILLSKGADIEARANDGSTPLIIAAIGGQRHIVEMLLRKGARIDSAQNEGYTPLLWAAYWGHTDLVKYLVEQGANPRAQTRDGYNALVLAAEGGMRQYTQYMLERNSMRRKFRSGKLIVPRVDYVGDLPMISALADSTVDVNAQTREGITALMRAAQKGSLSAIKALLRLGADPSLTDQQGQSALDYAKTYKQREVIRFFLNLQKAQAAPAETLPTS